MIRLQLCHAGFLPAALPYHCELKCQMSVHPQMSVRHFDLGPTFEEDGPIDMAWYLGSSRHIRTCRRIIRLQLGQGGSLETRTWILETRTWGLVAKSGKSVILEACHVNPLTHPPTPISLFPHQGAGGLGLLRTLRTGKDTRKWQLLSWVNYS